MTGKTTMTVAGIDAGNSETTFVAPRGRVITIPSFIGSGSLEELQRIRGGIGAGTLHDDEFVLEYQNRSYFIGRLAVEESLDATSGRGNINRYWDGHTLKLLLVLAGAAFRSPHLTMRLVTGLPVQVWSAEAKEKVRQRLLGTHRYTLNGEERTLTIEGVLVVMEGAGASALYGTDEQVMQGVIDVGGRTTDLFMSEGQRPIKPRCVGTDRGVEKVGDILKELAEHRYGRTLIPSEIRDILRAHVERRPHRPIPVDGVRITLDSEVADLVNSVGDEISAFVSEAWRSGEHGKVAAMTDQVLLIGGGAYYFAPRLRTLITHLKVPQQPEIANAKGYLAIGLQLTDDLWAKTTGTR